MENLNFNSLNVDDSGRVTFSGLSSGIDFEAAVDAIIAARRIPIDTLETRIVENADKITALEDLRLVLGTFQTAVSKLYGQVNFGNTNDIFQGKEAFATSARIDSGTATAAGTLMGVTVDNSAATGSHTIEVLQTAKAHKLSSDQASSLSTALGLTTGDSFTINGVTIITDADDTIQDLRDRINNANTGTGATEVTASIVSVSDTEHYLLLTGDKTGSTITLTDTSGTPLDTIGILTGASIKNELQTPQSARLYADGLLDQTNTLYESSLQTATTVQVGSNGTLTFTRDSDSAALGTVVYTSTDTLQDLADAITAGITDVTATVVTDGAGVRLEITAVAGTSITESGGGTAIDDLGIDNKRREITRTSNTIDDLFTGITLSLFQAEQGTTITLDIEQDLSGLKTEIANFVEAYNALRQVINAHRQINAATGEADDETGVLFSSSALSEITNRLANVFGAGAQGVGSDYQVLSQIGINFVDVNQTDPLLAETLEIDEGALDKALLNNADEVRRLFAFDFTTDDARVSLLTFNGSTTYSASGYTLNIQPASGDNLLQYSEQADNAYWTANEVTVSADVIDGPNGATTAEGLIGSIVLGTHYVTNTAAETVTIGTNYIYSTYVKAGDKDQVRIAFNGAGFGGVSIGADFNLATGALISNDVGIDATNIENVGNGWYRVSIKATAAATGDAFVETYSRDNALGTSFSGDGATINTHVFGAQLQEVTTETTPGDYIVTTNAARLGVVASANINGPADGSDDGTVTLTDNTLVVISGDAEGLQLFQSGLNFTIAVQLDFTVGVGTSLFFETDQMLDPTTGVVDAEIDQLTDQNTLSQSRVDEMLERLEIRRQNLLERFIKMEVAIARANSIMASIKNMTDAFFANR